MSQYGREDGEAVPDRRREPEEDNSPYAQIAIGLVLLIGGLVAGFGATFWITFGMSLGAAALIGNGVSELRRERLEAQAARGAVESPAKEANGEQELLSALRENGGRITPAEAAMETSLMVTEADEMLSDLASKGHLMVESQDGALFYRLPSRREERELEDSEGSKG